MRLDPTAQKIGVESVSQRNRRDRYARLQAGRNYPGLEFRCVPSIPPRCRRRKCICVHVSTQNIVDTIVASRHGLNKVGWLNAYRFGVPVVVHGLIEGYGRVTTAQIFREFGLLPSGSHLQAQQVLDDSGLVFVPLSVLSPGLSIQLALRSRLGLRNSAHSLVKMLDPFKGEGLLLAAATHPEYLDMMREVLLSLGAHGLLLRGTEGEPFANPKRRPRIEHLHDGVGDILFEAEHDSLKRLPTLPENCDAKTTADWMRRVLSGDAALPPPIANQLACCLYACGYADDFNQAKAIVAVEGNGLSAA